MCRPHHWHLVAPAVRAFTIVGSLLPKSKSTIQNTSTQCASNKLFMPRIVPDGRGGLKCGEAWLWVVAFKVIMDLLPIDVLFEDRPIHHSRSQGFRFGGQRSPNRRCNSNRD